MRSDTIEMTILIILSLLGYYLSYFFIGWYGLLIFPILAYIVGKKTNSLYGLMPFLLFLLPFIFLAKIFKIKINIL